MVYHGASNIATMDMPWEGVVTAAFLIGGFYPITQVYQHSTDAKDGVETISMLLGKRGTFIFCAGMYAIALGILFYYYMNSKQMTSFLVLQIFFIPILVFFVRWFLKVWKDENQANFAYTMQMNWMASTCTSMAFITLIILHQFV
jgi:1,4-dihydroxy-2-naphthoate octaprenyltransferase